MAISMNLTYKGIPVNGCYIRVKQPTIAASKDTIAFGVQYHATRDVEAFDEQPFSAPYSLTGDNPLRQAYLYLKALPAFAGATDC